MTRAYIAPSLRPSGRTFTDLRSGALQGHVQALASVNSSPTLDPTAAPTATATGGGSTGGALAAGSYYITFTELNGIGETVASPESAHLTVSAGNIPRVTFPTLKTGNVARAVYVTVVGGASGTETLYADGITAGTYDLAVATPAGRPAPPTANSTDLTLNQQDLARRVTNRSRDVFSPFRDVLQAWVSGAPIEDDDIHQRVLDQAILMAILSTTLNEMGALIVANPGTITEGFNVVTAASTENRAWS